MNDQINPVFFNFVAQVAHFSATYGLTLTAMLLFPTLRNRHRWIMVFAAIFVYACWHEFWYDPRYENAVTRGSDIEDWCFLVAGSTVAEIVAAIKFRFKLLAARRIGGKALESDEQ